MKKCSAIENLLPLYEEGILSEAEKRVVEEHLSVCSACQKELARLQRAGQMVHNLPEVEEPPWFKQKIMAQVREEAGKSSFVRKWFYPLRIKIPVQIMATLVIAVLAVYIYRSGQDEARRILPGAPPPAVETQTQQIPKQVPQTGKTDLPSAASPENGVSRDALEQNKTSPVQPSAGAAARKSEAPADKSPAAYDADASMSRALAVNKDEIRETSPAVQKEAGRPLPQIAEREKKPGEQVARMAEKKKESVLMSAPAAPRAMGAAAETQSSPMPRAVAVPEAKVFMQVGDPNAAAAEVEKILAGFDAKKMSRRQLDGKTMVTADVSAANWKEMLTKLKTVGLVEEKASPVDISGMIRVMIEISGG